MRLTWALPAGLLLFGFVPLALGARRAAEEVRRLTAATRSFAELRSTAERLRVDATALADGARAVRGRRHDRE